METLTVRQATPDDATELARLLDLFDHMGATPEQVAARMLACQHVLTTWIGEMDGQPVGFACLRLVPHLQGDEPYAELTDIYVDVPFRRQGVARALIAQVEAAAREPARARSSSSPGSTTRGRRRRIAHAATPIGRWRCARASRTHNERPGEVRRHAGCRRRRSVYGFLTS
jgi:GNAT superfamily N-acetyltransferase